jgi:hypothetical protein
MACFACQEPIVRRFAFVLGILLLPATAAAGELQYDDPLAGCPSREEVQARIDQRAPKARDVELKIQRASRDGGFVGDVVVGSGGDAVHRRLEGKTCDAVVNATVLVLALDRASAEPAATTPEPAPTSEPASAAAPARPERPTTSDRVVQRASVELGVGASVLVRQLDFSTVIGGELFGEVAALPTSWYRPSARLAFQHARSSPTTRLNAAMETYEVSSTLTGAAVDLCPLGIAAVSTRRVDLTFSMCGVFDVASAGHSKKQLWLDAGVVLRALVQIGPKDSVRGFVGVTGGGLQRIGDPFAPSTEPPVEGAIRYLAYPIRSSMWTMAVGGGVVFP